MATITRRRFLQGLGAGGALLASGCGSAGTSAGDGGTPPTPPPKKPILVLLFLDGGNDWLSMLPPLSGPNRTAYEAARPTLAIPTSSLVDLGGGVGLHPDFTGMADLHARGRVAWIPGIGMNNPNLSHFVSADLWGQGSAMPDGTGWLGRHADLAFDPAGDVLRGITVTSDLPVMLRGRVAELRLHHRAERLRLPGLAPLQPDRRALRHRAPRERLRRRGWIDLDRPGLRPRVLGRREGGEALLRRAERLRDRRHAHRAHPDRALPGRRGVPGEAARRIEPLLRARQPAQARGADDRERAAGPGLLHPPGRLGHPQQPGRGPPQPPPDARRRRPGLLERPLLDHHRGRQRPGPHHRRGLERVRPARARERRRDRPRHGRALLRGRKRRPGRIPRELPGSRDPRPEQEHGLHRGLPEPLRHAAPGLARPAGGAPPTRSSTGATRGSGSSRGRPPGTLRMGRGSTRDTIRVRSLAPSSNWRGQAASCRQQIEKSKTKWLPVP